MSLAHSGLRDEIAATLDWWRLAGVDHDFDDDVTAWLASKEPPAASEKRHARADTASPEATSTKEAQDAQDDFPQKPVERTDLLGPEAPASLEAFHQWWMEAPGLDAIGPRGRTPPRGPAHADLMVLVTDPEESDRGALLSGPQGRLLARMLTAMGIADDAVYLATALPRHTPMADTRMLANAGMDAVTLHHIALAAPKRVLALGSNIPPLIGHASAKDLSSLNEIPQKTQAIPLLVTDGLDSMLSMPRIKARFWRRWIEWSAKPE